MLETVRGAVRRLSKSRIVPLNAIIIIIIINLKMEEIAQAIYSFCLYGLYDSQLDIQLKSGDENDLFISLFTNLFHLTFL